MTVRNLFSVVISTNRNTSVELQIYDIVHQIFTALPDASFLAQALQVIKSTHQSIIMAEAGQVTNILCSEQTHQRSRETNEHAVLHE